MKLEELKLSIKNKIVDALKNSLMCHPQNYIYVHGKTINNFVGNFIDLEKENYYLNGVIWPSSGFIAIPTTKLENTIGCIWENKASCGCGFRTEKSINFKPYSKLKIYFTNCVYIGAEIILKVGIFPNTFIEYTDTTSVKNFSFEEINKEKVLEINLSDYPLTTADYLTIAVINGGGYHISSNYNDIDVQINKIELLY